MKKQNKNEIDMIIFKKLMPILLVLLFFLLAPKLFACNEDNQVKSGLFFPDTWTCPNLNCRYENYEHFSHCSLCGCPRKIRFSVKQTDDKPTFTIQSRINELKNELYDIQDKYGDHIPSPIYAVDKPPYNYFFILGKIWAYEEALLLVD